jgi:adenine-specific DNA-methyltransferase
MRSSAIFRALAIFHSPGSDDWRLSLMTATPERTDKGKVALTYSNPKRLSFFLGPNAKVNTPTKFILKREKIINFEDLKSRFSVEVVNKEFYKEISGLFTQLVGGSVQIGKKMENHEALLKLPDVQDHSQTSLEFAVRLIGRVIFCWFLREKKSNQSKSLMPHELLSLQAVKHNPDYYHNILEPIFFEVLNKPFKSRKEDYNKEPFSSIPYLNGGLFAPHDDDFFSYNGDRQAVNHNTVVIPDEWIRKFFEVLETYNFTIDENTSFDEELSIDPEMLGRIFENLLAEINPETGESARKNRYSRCWCPHSAVR